MSGKLPFQRAGALLVGAALIGVGATKLDLSGLTKGLDSPPDKKTNQQQEPRRLVLPEPKFGDLPPGAIRPRKSGTQERPQTRSPVSEITRTETTRPELLTSTSDEAMASTAPELSEWEQSIAADIEKTFEAVPQDPLPSPVFGMAREPELFANNDFDSAFGRDEDQSATVAGPAYEDDLTSDRVSQDPEFATSGIEEAGIEETGIEETGLEVSQDRVESAGLVEAGPEGITDIQPGDAEEDVASPQLAAAVFPPQSELPLPTTPESMKLAEDIDAAVALPPAANDNLPAEPSDLASTDQTFEAPISFDEMPSAEPPAGSTVGETQFAAAFSQDQRGNLVEPVSEQEAELEQQPENKQPAAASDAEPINANTTIESFASPFHPPPFAEQTPDAETTGQVEEGLATLNTIIPPAVDGEAAAGKVPSEDPRNDGENTAPIRLASLDTTSLPAPPGSGPGAPAAGEVSEPSLPQLAATNAPATPPSAAPPLSLASSSGTATPSSISSSVASLAPGEERSTIGYGAAPSFTFQDELILDIRVKGFDASDTVIAFGTRQGIYLPLGTLSRILDLAITVSDDGHYAAGWAISRDRAITLDLRNGVLVANGQEQPLPPVFAVAFEGELYLRSDQFSSILPLLVEVDLRQQAIMLETLEPFPFQERLQREADRAKLASRQLGSSEQPWPREETPWELASVPLADLELRTISDSARGERLEGDLRIAGDLAYLTAQAFLGVDTKDGLTTSLIEFGRTDPDATLLGPLEATEFSFGDISTVSLPIGLRGVVGRGVSLTNTQPEAASVFESIDLRGILPDGYEVELYRNDILIGSTVDAQNGQYEFLQVPVDFGLNIFRLVFFGPQGQRREEVRRIMVGDGRLGKGQFRYRFNAAQKDENLFGVRDPFFVPADDFGDWRVTGEVSYGVSSGVTATASGAWFQTPERDRWTVSGGLRTGLGQFALKTDIALADGDAFAVGAGVGGRLGNSTFTLDHIEYSGEFIDETKAIGRQFLRRSTELDFNTTINLGNPITGLVIPVTARARHFETADGRKQTNASVRASTRFSGLLASNTLEYSRNSFPQLAAFSQLFGNFDLASLGRSKFRTRASVGYQILPNPDLVSVGFEADYSIDHRTAIRGQVSYAFQSESTQLGLSAVREFDRFTLAFDSTYGLRDDNYSVGLRFATSFGRDPRSGGFFLARPGISSMGAASVRAFQDLDGDGTFGPTDRVIPEADFVAFNQTATTDETGSAFLGGLSQGRRVTLQLDPTSLPDITLAPVSKGIEIVPRPGRIHQSDFAVVALSEIEGNVTFQQANSNRGVSGVRLELKDVAGETAAYARTEIDGYYFFEQVKPGSYSIVIEKGQAERLNLCLASNHTVDVGHESDIYGENITILPCEAPLPKPAFGGE